MEAIKFAKIGYSSLGDTLVCPNCGGENLHHGRVSVYNRWSEDEEKGLCVSIDAQNATITDAMKGNPSIRRDGIKIELSCECCDHESVLTISQHKGYTVFKHA